MVTLIRVLIWADLVSFYALWVLMTYLTKVWKLSITHAAGILNIWGGIALILPIAIAYIADTLTGHYPILALSSIAYSIGLGFLSMSTPPILGSCSKYEPECIGVTQKALFYTALALIAIGISGHIVSLKPFVIEQSPSLKCGEDNSNRIVRPLKKRELVLALFTVIGGIALPYIKPWSIRFGIPAICTVVATILFLSSSCFYQKDGPATRPPTIFQRRPSNQKDLYKGDAPDLNNKYHTVTKIKKIKIFVRIISMGMTFLLCGIVSSAGSTYFQEQANNLSRNVGKLKVPLPILILVQQYAKTVFSGIYQRLNMFFEALEFKTYAVSIGIPGAMIFATLSCITAAKVEARRLDVIRSHNLFEKPEDTIPMTVFWVLPQFVMLAGLESFFVNSVTDYFCDQCPTSMAKYLGYFTQGVSGLGFMASVLSVYVVGKISERGGKLNWFQYTLSKSRLDNYFWTLSAMCAVNLFFYILVAYFYPYERETSNINGQQDEEQPET